MAKATSIQNGKLETLARDLLSVRKLLVSRRKALAELETEQEALEQNIVEVVGLNKTRKAGSVVIHTHVHTKHTAGTSWKSIAEGLFAYLNAFITKQYAIDKRALARHLKGASSFFNTIILSNSNKYEVPVVTVEVLELEKKDDRNSAKRVSRTHAG